MADAAQIAVTTVRDTPDAAGTGVELVTFVLFSTDAYAAFERALA
jgi:O-acetyl-ADP-ribose deacetylase (regulator of RNase III)